MRLAAFAAVCAASALAPVAALNAAPEPPRLIWPLACEIGKTCEVQHYVDHDPGPAVRDYRCGHRTNDKHDGTDIRILDMAAQRAGVDVLAAAAGRVVAVRDGVADISIRAPGAPPVAGKECGNRVGIALGDGWILDYCHLAQGSLRVKPGDTVVAGQTLGRVGLSGDTEFAHLHFSVRHNNAIVDPFAPDFAAAGCAARPGLWTPEAAAALAYKRGAVLNVGFTAAASPAAVEAHAITTPDANSPALVAYARLIGLEAGDVVEIELAAPDGRRLATNVSPPMARDMADWTTQVGLKRAAAWPAGVYSAEVRLRRAGVVAVSRRWQVRLWRPGPTAKLTHK